jgi:carboxypeptidase D
MTSTTFNSSITIIPRVLERIPLLLFVGDQDFICNYIGVENMIQAMTWNGGTGLGVGSSISVPKKLLKTSRQTVQTQSWTVGGIPAGTWVTSRNLTYAKVWLYFLFCFDDLTTTDWYSQVFNASHMVPFDVPHVSHDMILRFMGVDFAAIFEGSAKIPSSIGTESKPQYAETTLTSPTNLPGSGKSPEQDKAMWEGTSPLLVFDAELM